MIFHQFTDRADAAVAKIVDVVDFATAIAQTNQHLQDLNDVFLAQNAHFVIYIEVEAHVHFHTTNGREIIAFLVEEQGLEHGLRGFLRWRLARTHDAVDVGQSAFAAIILVEHDGIAHPRTDGHIINVQHVDFGNARLAHFNDLHMAELLAGFGIDFAIFGIGNIKSGKTANQLIIRH